MTFVGSADSDMLDQHHFLRHCDRAIMEAQASQWRDLLRMSELDLSGHAYVVNWPVCMYVYPDIEPGSKPLGHPECHALP